jgi:hypothetical protein
MLKRRNCFWTLVISAVATTSAGAQAWKDKQIAEWTPDEARQVLTESPWAKSVAPTLDSGGVQPRAGLGSGGIGMGGVGIGIPGMGRRRMGSGQGTNGSANPDPGQIPALTVRWASAMPVSAAELIAHEVNAPSVDEDHYAIAVYGIPGSMIKGDPNSLGEELKKHATIKREGKKDMKPSSAQILIHDEGPVFLYLFPRSTEITRKDKLEFDAEVGRLKFAAAFLPEEMVYAGKLEL